MVDRIVLNGIRVRGRHGVSPAERARPQDFVIDLACSTDATLAASSDELSATVDYSRLSRIATTVAADGSYRLLETLAERIAEALLAELQPQWLRVRVTKVAPEGVGVPASVEIERGSRARPRSAPVELHVSDLEPAKRFYGALGFKVAREEHSAKDSYLVMAHGADVLRFWSRVSSARRRGRSDRTRAPVRRGRGVEIVLTFDDLDGTFERAAALGTIVEPILLREWGLRDFRVLDPFGFYVRCTEPHDPLRA